MVTFPKLTFVQSPNYSSRNGDKVDLIVVHDCEGSYAGSINWFARPVSGVSAHLVLSEDGLNLTQMVHFPNKAWHACDFNGCSEGLEMAGYSSKGFNAPEWDAAAAVVAWRLKANNLPPVWSHGGFGPGFTSHFDLGLHGGGHTDPTTDTATWLAFIDRVQKAYDQVGASEPDLSTTISQQPPAAPEGYVPHRTNLHDFVVGSLDWVQQRINALGYGPNGQPIQVDGIYGPDTWNSVARYQKANGLTVDGIPGPATIASLEKDATPCPTTKAP
jgi:hypothetical protein